MNIVSFLASFYLIITVMLMLKKKEAGNLYMIYGLMTFIFVMGYASIPSIAVQFQNIAIFIVFSLMILLFGLSFGTMLTLFNKSNKASIIASIIASSLLIVLLFNIRGYISYMYIPVLLYMIQGKVSDFIRNNKINNE